MSRRVSDFREQWQEQATPSAIVEGWMVSSSYRGDVWAWRLDGGTAMSDVARFAAVRHTLTDGYRAHRQQHNLSYNSIDQQHVVIMHRETLYHDLTVFEFEMFFNCYADVFASRDWGLSTMSFPQTS
jgi:hypothetical protein